MELFLDVLGESLVDTAKMLPFLFLAYLLIEYIETRHGERIEALLAGGGRWGAVPGAVLGCVPQCGFSAIASNFYSSRVITLGTLMAVYLATSDEAIPLLVSMPAYWDKLVLLMVIKVVYAIAVGFVLDFVLRGVLPKSLRGGYTGHADEVDCHEKHEEKVSIWRAALRHTAELAGFILLFSLVGLLFLAMAYLAFVKRWCKNVSAGNIIAGMAILFSSCGIWYSVGRTLFYEISISSGFAFVALGAYFLFSSNVLSEGKVSLVRTALASLFLGIAVLCRPTLAVYAVVAVLYFLYAIPKSGNVLVQAEDGTSSLAVRKPRRIAYVLCAALPLLALGITQMVYNYARFGSPLDFGIQYSLTINDFTHSQYHTSFVLIGLWNYLFAPPQFLPEYPYISTPFSKLDTNGFYFNDDGNTSGILFLAIPVAAYLLARAALRRLPDTKTRWKYGVMVGLPCVVMPLVIICSIWESGYAVRYTADFSWEILLGALTILFFLYQKSRNETKKDLTRKFMAAAMLCAVVVNGVQIFKFAFPQDQYPAICDHLTQLIAFWK